MTPAAFRRDLANSGGTMRKLIACVWILFAFGAGVSSAYAENSFLTWADTLPQSLDPHAVFDTEMQFVLYNVYDGLYRYEGNPPKLEPWLAESYTVAPDGLTWDFKLRHGVKFHDGSELTAADVVYSFQRLLALGKAPSGAFSRCSSRKTYRRRIVTRCALSSAGPTRHSFRPSPSSRS